MNLFWNHHGLHQFLTIASVKYTASGSTLQWLIVRGLELKAIFPQTFHMRGQNKMTQWNFGNLALKWGECP